MGIEYSRQMAQQMQAWRRNRLGWLEKQEEAKAKKGKDPEVGRGQIMWNFLSPAQQFGFYDLSDEKTILRLMW